MAEEIAEIPTELARWDTPSNRSTQELNGLRDQIENLVENEQYDDDFLAPSEYAVKRTTELLGQIQELLSPLHSGHISTEGAGSVRTAWNNNSKEICLVIPATPEKQHYIYHEDDSHSDIEKIVTAETLSTWLKWLFD